MAHPINTITPNRRGFTRAGRIGKVYARGARLDANVVSRVTWGEVDLSVEEVSQIRFTISDPDLKVLSKHLFMPGTSKKAGSHMEYDGVRFECSALEVSESESDGLVLDVTGLSLGAQRLRRQTGALVHRNVSPTRFARHLAGEVGLRFVGQETAQRGSVQRKAGDGEERETSWDTLQRLASEVGFICFEVLGTVHFGKPTWLAKNADRELRVAYRRHGMDPRILHAPTCRRSANDSKKRVATVELEATGDLGDDARPGQRFILDGVPGFEGRYLTQRVTIPLDDGQPVFIAAATPENPEPMPPPKPVKVGSPGYTGTVPTTSSTGATGRGTASAFVAVAQEQLGDTYIYGSEASVSDPNPGAFDCSELVQWALGRVGVPFVDGSSAQIAACRGISVETAMRTRGALLWHPGHIAISLGNGRTIEAANSRVGVVSYSAAGRFQRGGLVPGLAY